MRQFRKAVLFMLLFALLTGCYSRDGARTETGGYSIDSVRIYQDTPVWELAKAVKDQDTKKIAKIAKATPELLDYQDPLYGTTLLFWAVGMEKYNAVEALLKAGTNPDIISTYEGGTALYRAAGFSFVDMQAKKDAKYVKLLLAYGADPNMGFVGNDHNNSTEIGTTPLMASIACGIEKTKALVEGGADINYKLPSGKTAALDALRWVGPNTLIEAKEYAYYLIVEKKAEVSYSYIQTVYDKYGQPFEKEQSPVQFLRNWLPKLDSDEYKMKMELIDEFARQGVDYWSTEIPKDRLDQIKKLYPDTWQEYIQKY